MTDTYEERIAKLATPEACAIFAKNAEDRDRPDLAIAARRRAVEIRTDTPPTNIEATTEVERESLRAVYAYEEILSKKRGKRTRATGTWQKMRRHGILQAVELAVNQEEAAESSTSLAEMGMLDFAFENVVLRHPESFKDETVEGARSRVESWKE